MQATVLTRNAKPRQTGQSASARRRFSLTPSELQQLGMFRVAYLTGATGRDSSKIVIHSADGMPLATPDTIEVAVDIANELGLALVAVH